MKVIKIEQRRLCKKIILELQIFFITNPGEYLKESSIPIKFPLFLKPVTGGDSRGVDKIQLYLILKVLQQRYWILR